MTQNGIIASASTTADQLAFADKLHSHKYRDKDQTREEHAALMAKRLSSNPSHEKKLLKIFADQWFLPAGRVQAAAGSSREVSYFNCNVSGTIEDNMDSIMLRQHEAAKTLRLGTGVGYNWSHLRPANDLIVKLQTESCGPIPFMHAYDGYCKTIMSAGHRRGAQMGILNVSHPDIISFINAKSEPGVLNTFNLSVGITDDFMQAVIEDRVWELVFNDKVYSTIPARDLWSQIMTSAYETAEPGILFLDAINRDNNLWYCENIEATNPCSEQPLPPHGMCLLGSFNLTKYFHALNWNRPQLEEDMLSIVEAYDNIYERSKYAVPSQKIEALQKRRMGLGYTGIANALETYHISRYGNETFCMLLEDCCQVLRDAAYYASAELAKTRGSFDAFDKEKYLSGQFAQTLPDNIRSKIAISGIRNSHLISYAPCGTISMTAGNLSSGVEPVFHYEMDRAILMKEGRITQRMVDYNVRQHRIYGKTLEECTIEDHINVGKIVQKYCDSSVSKTINVPSHCTYADYQSIYLGAYHAGIKGITVYRPTELRGSVIKKAESINEAPDSIDITDCIGDKCAFGSS